MNPKQPMTQEQLKFIKHEIQKAYLFLLGHSDIDPGVIELIQRSAFAEAQRRYQAKEPW